MPKCNKCAWFPWKPGLDLLGTPAVKCHPDLPARRWSNISAEMERDCQNFNPGDPDGTEGTKLPDSGTGEVNDPATTTGESQPPEASTEAGIKTENTGEQPPATSDGAVTEQAPAGASPAQGAGSEEVSEPDNTGDDQPVDDTGAVRINDTDNKAKDEVKKTIKRNRSTGTV